MLSSIGSVITKRSLTTSAPLTNSVVYAWGSNKTGALGLGDIKHTTTATPISFFHKDPANQIQVQYIATGAKHSAFIDQKGQVYTCGENKYYQLGLGNKEITTHSVPVKIQNGLPKIKSIACGAYHTIALSVDNQVYVWGWGGNIFTQGALGLGNKNDAPSPRHLTALSDLKIVQVTAGDEYSLALTEDGNVYSWGNGEYGRLGTNSSSNQSAPVLVESFSAQNIKIKHISSGRNFNLCIDTDNNLWSFGRDDKGALGTGPSSQLETNACSSVPVKIKTYFSGGQKIDNFPGIKLASCGDQQCAAYSLDGKLFLWGQKLWLSPQEVSHNRLSVTQIACGNSCTSIVDHRGILYSWGKSGSLLGRTFDQPALIDQFNRKQVVQLVGYGDHMLALVNDNKNTF